MISTMDFVMRFFFGQELIFNQANMDKFPYKCLIPKQLGKPQMLKKIL